MGDSKAIELRYNGTLIREQEKFLNLTDMWRAAGSDNSRRPAQWIRKEGAEFVRTIGVLLNVPDRHNSLFRTNRGVNGGTWAHWQLSMAYGQYLSPEFHAWCNSVVRAHMEGGTTATHENVSTQTLAVVVGAAMREIVPSIVAMVKDQLAPMMTQNVERALVAHDGQRTGVIGPRGAQEICAALRYIAKVKAAAFDQKPRIELAESHMELRKLVGFYGIGSQWENLPIDKLGDATRELAGMRKYAHNALKLLQGSSQLGFEEME